MYVDAINTVYDIAGQTTATATSIEDHFRAPALGLVKQE